MQLLTRKEVQEMLKISESTVIRMEKKGILKRVRLPHTKKPLYDMADIEELVEASKEKGEPPQAKSNDE
jgi:predicted site-specific integrase-resolvase